MKNILVAPLNWGLGHATRCIPIINELINHGYTPIIASDGDALKLLQEEFPEVKSIELPSYKIRYAQKGKNFKYKIFFHLPKILKTANKEHKFLKKIAKDYSLNGIISDNRLGMYHNNIPSVFITHQLNVLSGNFSKITSAVHFKYIKKYNECWIPDYEHSSINLSGRLGHLKNDKKISLKYIGALSRLSKKEVDISYDLMVLLSGPEPQRSILENILLEELKSFTSKILFVRGVIEDTQIITENEKFTIYNFMTSAQIESAINKSKLILSRSGYTTIMDLAKLEKKAFFIPTPGQYEQEYLAKKFKEEGICPSCNQEKFIVKKLNKVDFYKGFKDYYANATDWEVLFRLF